MPTYEYRCPKCQKVFEKVVELAKSGAPQRCPDCDVDAEKIVSLPGPVHPSASSWRL